MLDIWTLKTKIVNYVTLDIWRIRLRDLSSSKAFFLRQLRIVLLTIRGFLENRCLLRASALTFYSLLSVGPVVALIFAIAKGFGMEKLVESQIVEKRPVQDEVRQQVVEYAHSLLENTQGGMIAGIGIVLLMWSVLKVLNHIEISFNDIWLVKHARSWKLKITNYLAFIVIAPILLLMYTSIPVFMSSQIIALAGKISVLEKVSPLFLDLLSLSPYVLMWGLFTIIYILMPNTKVDFVPGLLGGIIAGTIFMLVQLAYIQFQVGVTRYNPIYGSIAALPLLLIWLNLGWIILLVGAQYSFAHQNVDNYEFEPDYKNISPHLKRLLTLQVLHLMAKRFADGERPLTTAAISQFLDIPSYQVTIMLNELVDSGLVSTAEDEEFEAPAFQPASDINLWTVTYIIDKLERKGVTHIPVTQHRGTRRIEAVLKEMGAVAEVSPANKMIKDL